MDAQRKVAVVRSLASAATAAGLVFASWSTPANASTKSDYHGIDVASLRSSTSVVSGPMNPMRINSDVFSPRDTKEKDQKTKSPTKGTGSKSKAKGSATGTKSASKHAVKNDVNKQDNKVDTKEASKARGSATGTQSQSKHGTESAGTQAGFQQNGAPAGIQIFTPQQTGTAGTNNAAAGTATSPSVLGVQTNNTPGAMTNGTATTGGTSAGVQTNGTAVLGVESLPSTSTAEVANLAGAGLALVSAGGGVLMIRRRRK